MEHVINFPFELFNNLSWKVVIANSVELFSVKAKLRRSENAVFSNKFSHFAFKNFFK